MLLLTEQQVAEVLTPEICFNAVRDVFRSMQSEARNFPVIRENLGYADAIYGFKSGFDPASGALGLKSGGYWPGNEQKGLTNHQSTIFMFDPDTGQCQAVIGANLITALRTAAAAAVSIDLLARQDSEVLGIVGTGHQSAFQMEAALAIRPFRQVLIWNRSGRSLERHRQIAERFGVELTETDLQAVCRGADALITITSSFAALVCDQWIRPGTHIACMGTDTTGKQEIEPGLALRASRYTDELAQSRTIGEFQHLAKEIGITPIGAVITGQAAGRAAQNEITIYDGTGVGLQDLACARMVVQAFDPIQQGASGKPQAAVA